MARIQQKKMNMEELRARCLNKPFVSEDFPFDESTLVLRVGGKIFAFLPLEKPGVISLKCDPEKALALREEFPAITGAYHLNKKHWNAIEFLKIPHSLLLELIDHSYNLVFISLPAGKRKELQAQAPKH
jgi:predicted DNA-binding protein (MmcQ/YjbR family)